MSELERLTLFFQKFYGMSPTEAARQATFYLGQAGGASQEMGQKFLKDSTQANMLQEGQVPITKPTLADFAAAGLQRGAYAGPDSGPTDLKLHDMGAANSKPRDAVAGKPAGKRDKVNSGY